MDRLELERRFHDRQAARRAMALGDKGDAWRVDAEAYLHHESWVRPALARLGPLTGRRVLDYGCGHGMAAVVLAHWGATVTALDIAAGYLAEAQRRARANNVVIHCVQADAEALPFAAGAFEAIWGHAILHHLQIAQAAAEVARVLRPGGVAVFCEPWGGNPLLEAARRYLPYPGKDRTPDERPLTRGRLKPLYRHFEQVSLEGFQLLSWVGRLGYLPGLKVLRAVEEWVLHRYPTWHNWCRYVVITCRKGPNPVSDR
ncbi:MAG: methyltransferase domain-containing protein [Gemmataceae bacterium]|nr:methyltransferase domain-containing protein [Gemmataceae bacterium]MDW8243486.1 class I SAM-dependent methyltransferase [Thermogemmata sp.]